MKFDTFKAAIASALVLLVTVAALLLSRAARCEDMAHAPVFVPSGTPGIMVQDGWYAYKKIEDAILLYCSPLDRDSMRCVLWVTKPEARGAAIVTLPIRSDT